ncbi:MAG: ureidoglycolate lyase [Pseudomonadota bacterium]
MPETLRATPLTADAFAPFGDVIALPDTPGLSINQGLCQRHSDLAQLSHDPQGRMGISLFDAEPRALPYRLEMLERHPLGAQAFLPMTQNPFLVIVAPDAEGRPGPPRAFLTAPGQGVNYHRGTWHAVLTPLHAPGLFAVVDRIGPGQNLEEHWLDQPLTIT